MNVLGINFLNSRTDRRKDVKKVEEFTFLTILQFVFSQHIFLFM